MREINRSIADVKPSELQERDRFHTAMGLFEVIETNCLNHLRKGYMEIEARRITSGKKKPLFIAVHKSARFQITRPTRK